MPISLLRPYILLCSLALSSPMATADPGAKISNIELAIQEIWSVPLTEISGASLHEKSLYLASDNSRNFLRIPSAGSTSKDLDLGKAEEIKVKEKDGQKLSKKSQWEGLAIDKAGSIFAIKESDDVIFQFTNDSQHRRSYQLTVFDQRSHKTKGYEGLLLLKKSHILLALSKDTILVEFGPKGDSPLGLSRDSILASSESFTDPASDELYPLAHWRLASPGQCQLSDLALDSEGKPLALLKTCSKIIRIPQLDPSLNVFTPEQSWSLPDELDHAEALLTAAPNGFLVAIDQKSEKKNLFWLVPKTKAAKP
ncbi:MAG: esterase-like activity of phytase family protein [Oligoflexus sp.]|nr:esterase-like activity of phytase family protein [Oligoflexus sp.]